MTKTVFKCLLILFPLFLLGGHSSYAEKYAGEFLTLGVGGRALGMGGTSVAVANDASSGYWNPAGLAHLSRRELILMHSERFGDLLNHDFIAYAQPISEEATTFGVSLMRTGGGGIKITDTTATGRPYVVSVESHADYTLFLSYALRRSDQLSFGGNAKLIYRGIAHNSAYGGGVDLGVVAGPFSGFVFGANLMDATTTLLAYDTGTKELVNPTLKVGTAFSRRAGILRGRFTVAFDADLRFEGRKYAAQRWLGKASADFHLGAEYWYRNIVAARIGSDEGNLTAGVGLVIRQFTIDGAFLSHEDLDNTYRVSVSMGL